MSSAFLARMAVVTAQRNTETSTQSRKRRRDDSSAPNSDNEDDDPPTHPALSGTGTTSRNAQIAVKNFATKQKLRGEQLTQLDTFLNDVQTVREGKLFVLLLALQNDVGNIIVATPGFSISPELHTNINSFALTVLLSPKLAQYRGSLSVQHVMQILLKHQFDLPPGIENNPADMDKTTTTIRVAFTQARSSIKKKRYLRACRLYGPKTTRKSLSTWSHRNTRISLALHRLLSTGLNVASPMPYAAALLSCGTCFSGTSTNNWRSLDDNLAGMRMLAKGSDDACDVMIEDLITADKDLHGAVDIVYQITNDIQQEVDDLIDAASANLASTAASTTPDAESDGPGPDTDQ